MIPSKTSHVWNGIGRRHRGDRVGCVCQLRADLADRRPLAELSSSARAARMSSPGAPLRRKLMLRFAGTASPKGPIAGNITTYIRCLLCERHQMRARHRAARPQHLFQYRIGAAGRFFRGPVRSETRCCRTAGQLVAEELSHLSGALILVSLIRCALASPSLLH
jgi:hypothetical protein